MLALAAALDSEKLIPSDAVSVLLVGSRARGWHHARSDFDVVVVTAQPWPGPVEERQPVSLPEPSIAVALTAVDGVRCEVKYWTESQIEALFAKVSWDNWDAGAAAVLGPNERLLAERMPHAQPLRGIGWHGAMTGRLRDSALSSYLSLAALGRADDCLDDVSGLIESGDLRGAVLAAQSALVHVADALTASLGHPGTDSKWRLRRLEAAGSGALSAAEYWRLATFSGFSADQSRQWLDHVTFRCSQIMLDVRLGR